jgi:hypothetical protein
MFSSPFDPLNDGSFIFFLIITLKSLERYQISRNRHEERLCEYQYTDSLVFEVLLWYPLMASSPAKRQRLLFHHGRLLELLDAQRRFLLPDYR